MTPRSGATADSADAIGYAFLTALADLIGRAFGILVIGGLGAIRLLPP
ncbi:hypothetical protein [Herbiconiux solani]|nr:hypothetical protein [Herbiconiux solani]